MNLKIDKSFEKDTNKINDKSLKLKIVECIENILNVEMLEDIEELKKLKGFKKMYRIKIGDYRIGLKIESDTIKLIRFLHRKEIYRYFPKK
jgi:mRNA interferase RelE/StbE